MLIIKTYQHTTLIKTISNNKDGYGTQKNSLSGSKFILPENFAKVKNRVTFATALQKNLNDFCKAKLNRGVAQLG